MANFPENVTYIRYEFSVNDIDATLTSVRNDIEQSIEKYIRLCEKVLQQRYPNAEIEIVNANQTEIATSTLVYSESGDEIHSENEIVETLCQQVYSKFDWVISKNLVPIFELSASHTDLPRSIIRWACNQDLIDGAGKPYGYWDIPLKTLSQLNEDIEIVNSKTLTATSDLKRKACYLEDVSHFVLAQMPERIELLIVARNGFGIPLFETDTSSTFISKKGSQIHIVIEHFVDISKWANDEWTYSRYVKALAEQAQRRNIKSEHQTNIRNGREIIDGISFHFVEAVAPEITLQELINKVLQNISKIIETAEQSLDGGPIWDDINDEIYQKNEDLFCQEILKPLLKKMGFQHVRYVHGTKEHGRDFYFEYNAPLAQSIHFGLQAKRGKLTGRANKTISTILTQIETAFRVPYLIEPETSETKVYISIMILAISGEFTENALQIIRSKIPTYTFPIGSVYFWDKHTIQDLIALYWGRSNK